MRRYLARHVLLHGRLRKRTFAVSVLLLIASPLLVIPSVLNPAAFQNAKNDDSLLVQGAIEEPRIDQSFALSDASGYEGVLNPVLVDQSGYAASENVSARTDSRSNLQYDLPIDDVHNWVADEAEVSVWNLQRLYAINGSFETGLPGVNQYPSFTYHPTSWEANATDMPAYSDDEQFAGYDGNGSKYVSVTSGGWKWGQFGFGHSPGTRVVWMQQIENTPYTEEFIFNLDYFYLSGPIDGPDGLDPVVGNASLNLFIDGEVVWSMSLLLIPQRGVWFNTGDIPITLTEAPSSFLLEVGIRIDEEMFLATADDYDGDPLHIEDGAANAAYISVYMDDISFIKATPPTAADVGLEFLVGGESAALTGSAGLYSASISNTSYWNTDPVTVSLNATRPVSFDYKTRLFSHRFTNSSWTTIAAYKGVQFTAVDGLSSQLGFYTYVGYMGDYEDPSMEILYPFDWDNATVSDPFLDDVTSYCTVGSGSIAVPTSIIDNLGWWHISLEAPNYGKSIASEILGSGWSPESIYRIGNTTRAAIEIGTATQEMDSLSGVNVTWLNSMGSVWESELLNGGLAGAVYGSSHVFNTSHSPAGEWCLTVRWNNGTEIAYRTAHFELHHSTTLYAEPASIDVIAGQTVNGLVRYIDGDTGTYLMDQTATMTGNWSTGFVAFGPDPVNNWWEASLRTNETGAGVFVVEVTVSRPYFDDASCYLTITSEYDTRLSSPDSPWTSAQWGEMKELTFFLEMYDFSTESWIPMDDASDLTVDLNWSSGYWSWSDEMLPGIYSTEVNTTALPSGNYLLNATFAKPAYRTSYSVLALIISPVATSLTIEGSSSTRLDIDDSWNITLIYRTSLNAPISGASVSVDEISPATGLDHTTVEAVPGQAGTYSLTITPRSAGVFTIRFLATEAHSEPATTVFVVVVNDVETSLTISGSHSVYIGLTDVYNTTFRYEMLNGTGIPDATIEIFYTGPTLSLTWDVSELGNGDYSIEVASTASGTFLVTIAASEEYYQSASDAFFLVVEDIATELTVLNGTADFVSFGSTYDLWVRYANSSGYGLDDADVEVVSCTPAVGLSWGSAVARGDGLFSMTLTPSVSNTFTLVLRANFTNHQTQFETFTLTATAIAASLTVLNTSTSISFDQTYELYVLYQSEALVGLENATLVVENPPASLGFSAFDNLGGGYYLITITPSAIGIYDIVIRASQAGYQSDVGGFTLGVSRIPTELVISGGISSDSVNYSSEYSLTVFYQRTDVSSNISDAIVAVETFPETGLDISILEVGDGYLIQANAEHIGRWTLSITAQKENYASSLAEFILDVDPLEIQVVLLSQASDTEGRLHQIRVGLTEAVSGLPVSAANVSYRISDTGTGEFVSMTETDEPGVYVSYYRVPVSDNPQGFTLKIMVEKENYFVPLGGLSQSFTILPDWGTRMGPLVAGSGSSLAFIIFLFVGYRTYRARKKRKILSALQVRRRFDDVQNIMGVIVLNKKSGLPIYSRILRGGFDESMVSAFITAITHFRSEFGMDERHWEYNVVPISDIISAVPTRTMIVAFLTVRPPSKYQEISMEAYGRAAGAMFDDIVETSRTFRITGDQAQLFNNLFLDLMDGILIERYHLKEDASLPKSMDCLASTAGLLEKGEGFRLEDLAKGMASCGVEETFAYKMVMDAVDGGMIRVSNGENANGVTSPFIDKIKQQMIDELKDTEDEE